MNAFKELPARIRQIRMEQGLSQENMAEGLKISTTAYGDMERGKTEITLSRLAIIANLFKVDIFDLLVHTSEKQEKKLLEKENERLLRLNLELTFRNRLLEQRLKELSEPATERKKIGF